MPIVAPVTSNAAIISIQSQPVPSHVIAAELKEWGLDGWDWKIQQISDAEFAVTFPSKESLRMMASCSSFTLPLNQVVVSVKAAQNGARSVASLSDIWVLLDDVPSGLRNTRFLMSFGELIGKPVEVDASSLDRLGPARMKIWCVNPSLVLGYIDIFPSSDAYRIRVRAEVLAAQQDPPPPPPNPSNPDPQGGDDNAGAGSNAGGEAANPFTASEWEGLGSEARGMFDFGAPASGAGGAGASADGAAGAGASAEGAGMSGVAGPGLAAGDKEVGTPFSAVCSNIPLRPTSPSLSGIVDVPPPAPLPMGPVSKKPKSTVKIFSAKSRGSSGAKQSVADLCRRLDADLGAAAAGQSGGDASSPAARSSAVPARSPVSTARKGLRRSNTAEHSLDRAERRAAAKNLCPPGASTFASPVRLVLPSISDSHLVHVLSDVGVSLDGNVGSTSSLLSLIRANEVAQAAIAKAKELAAGKLSASAGIADVAEGVGSGPLSSATEKRARVKRVKSCVAPCRSSLRIKNLSFK